MKPKTKNTDKKLPAKKAPNKNKIKSKKVAIVKDTPMSAELVEKTLLDGDLSDLTVEEKLNYYQRVCKSMALNPLTKPFEFITLKKKLVMYATRNCTDQLRNLNKISLKITDRKIEMELVIVTAQGSMPDGRQDESIGVVPRDGASGAELANLIMKAETKAKRRVTLSMVGLGMMDESELDTVDYSFVGHENDSETITIELEPMEKHKNELSTMPKPVREIFNGLLPYREYNNKILVAACIELNFDWVAIEKKFGSILEERSADAASRN